MTPEELVILGRITEHLKTMTVQLRAFTRTTQARTRELKPKVRAMVHPSRRRRS